MQNDIIQTLAPHKKRMHDDYYFRHIFKKTEKVCRAVFYISSQAHTSTLVREVEQSALNLLKVVTDSLKESAEHGSDLSPLTLAYIDLESKLGLLAATGDIPQEHFNVFVQEIDTARRAINSYTPAPERILPAKKSPEPRAKAPVIKKDTPVQVPIKDMRISRILNVLKDKPNATVKDIMTTLTDVSEKTIQRDLITLIQNRNVHKEGIKRWSKYSLVG